MTAADRVSDRSGWSPLWEQGIVNNGEIARVDYWEILTELKYIFGEIYHFGRWASKLFLAFVTYAVVWFYLIKAQLITFVPRIRSCDYFWYFSCGKRHRFYYFPRAVWVSKACEPLSDQFWLDINLCAFHRLLTLRCLCHIAYRLDGFSNLKALLR